MEATKEEEEEDGFAHGSWGSASQHISSPPALNRYAPPVARNTSTPPPQNIAQRQFSPQRPMRSASPVSSHPPPRAQTSSPGLHFGRPKPVQKPRDPYERPSSALAHSMVPDDYPAEQPQRHSLPLQQRKDSIQLNFLPPNDYTAQDVLCRWQGAPIFTWRLGGTVTTMFPVRTNRFSSDLHNTMIKCSPGEVKTRPLKDVLAPPEHIEKFPGPMWTGSKSANKAKKKEAMTYMDSRIEGFEKQLLEIYDPNEARMAQEKCMLWKIVRILVENDGAVEGTSEIDTAVRKVLIPEIAQTVPGENTGFVPMDMSAISALRPANAETVDAEALEEFRTKLLSGDREAAVWYAADKRLWAHALLIASTAAGKDLWKRVLEEFIKTEVKTLGEGFESMAMLYATLAGNWEESINELVPLSARTGVPMLSSTKEQRSVEERLTKWRESLALILSNRSPGDQTSILALGRLLAGYGWTAAAHICFIFARKSPLGGGGAFFGGPEDPMTDFCLLGTEHRNKSQLGRDLDSIILSEIYELAVSLAPHASTATPVFPHLQMWKIHHAMILAENGNKTAAQKYCDAVAAAVKAWNKPNPYFDQKFGRVLEDFTKRLQEAPRDASSSGANGSGWIPKLTSEAMSSSMWGAFNKFISGEDDVQGANGSYADVDGPFGKITPSVSRVQSSADLYGSVYGGPMYTNHTPGSSSPTATRPSRYAPSTGTARSSMESSRPNTYESGGRRASQESYRGPGMSGGGYEPTGNSYEPYGQPMYGYDPSSNPYSSLQSVSNSYAPRASLEVTLEVPEQSNTPQNSGYDPYSTPANGSNSGYQPSQTHEPPASTGGYEPPTSGGYEPPSSDFLPYQPEPESDEEKKADDAPKPKKKGMFDDDDDDELIRRAEAVKKAAEEEAKRNAAEAEKEKAKAAEGTKKGWFGGWFGRKDPAEQSGPIKAKLGEENAFVYDPDLGRWVNKKAGAAAPESPKTAPPPRRTPPVPSASAPPIKSSPMTSVPPSTSFTPSPAPTPVGLAAPPPARLTSSPAPPGRPTPPPSRPATAGGDAMDELLGPPMARKGTPAGGRKARKGGASRYVEVIPGQQ